MTNNPNEFIKIDNNSARIEILYDHPQKQFVCFVEKNNGKYFAQEALEDSKTNAGLSKLSNEQKEVFKEKAISLSKEYGF
ncbi:hypothetical protein ATL39_0913 [Sinobaca qinghaiensis]|uniref:Uncharacterized protein n=1 Tax=Sinobaca qinghaiensis TaxID=342944 RepID=A0A419V5F5_9BACL|nr:hypothetical protein [Sinobaca qinghaiensis]RKD75215.1 hypothetical protein ATL39_0913 [Sinobaca qinghaiensis]